MDKEVKGKYYKPLRDRNKEELMMKRAHYQSIEGLRSEIKGLKDSLTEVMKRLEQLEGGS